MKITVFICSALIYQASGEITAIPSLGRMADYLSMYSRSSDKMIGLKLALNHGNITVQEKEETEIQDFLVKSQLDYLDTHHLSAEAEANLIATLLKGNAEAKYSVTKFGEWSQDSVAALLVYERITKIETIDPCSGEIFESLFQYSTLPDNLTATHVVVGKKFKIRAEIAIKIDKSRSMTNLSSTANLQGQLQAFMGLARTNASVDEKIQAVSMLHISISNVIVKSNVNIKIPFPEAVEDIPAFITRFLNLLLEYSSFGEPDSYLIEELSIVAVCQGIQAPENLYPEYSSSFSDIVRNVFQRFEQISSEYNGYYNGVESFKACFAARDLEWVRKGRGHFMMEIKQLKFFAADRITSYRNKSLEHSQFLVDMQLASNTIASSFKKIEEIGNYYDRNDSVVTLVNVYRAIYTYGITCWPENNKIYLPDSQFINKRTHVLLLNGSSPFSANDIEKILNFSVGCYMNCSNCICHVIDCSHLHMLCSNYTAVSEFPLNSSPTWSDTKVVDAIVYNYQLVKQLEFVADLVIVNQDELLKILTDKSLIRSRDAGALKNLSQIGPYFMSKSDGLNPIEKLVSMEIPVILPGTNESKSE